MKAASPQRPFRDEFLNTELFASVAEALTLAELWRGERNSLRVDTALEAAQEAAVEILSRCCAWVNEGAHLNTMPYI